MQRLCELSSEPPSDDTLTVHHDTLQRILFDEIGETDGNPPSTESSGVSRGSEAQNNKSPNSTIPDSPETPRSVDQLKGEIITDALEMVRLATQEEISQVGDPSPLPDTP